MVFGVADLVEPHSLIILLAITLTFSSAPTSAADTFPTTEGTATPVPLKFAVAFASAALLVLLLPWERGRSEFDVVVIFLVVIDAQH